MDEFLRWWVEVARGAFLLWIQIYGMFCAILDNLINVKNTHGGLLLLLKLQVFSRCVFTSIQIAQRITYTLGELYHLKLSFLVRCRWTVYMIEELFGQPTNIFCGLEKKGKWNIGLGELCNHFSHINSTTCLITRQININLILRQWIWLITPLKQMHLNRLLHHSIETCTYWLSIKLFHPRDLLRCS